MHFLVITDHSALEALKNKSILTGRLLRRAEKLLEYNFDIIYCSGKDNVVSDFLSRNIPGKWPPQLRTKKNKKLPRVKTNFFPFANRSCLLERAHRTYISHLRTAKLLSFMLARYFWSGFYKDVENVTKSCLTCARIHSTVDYKIWNQLLLYILLTNFSRYRMH